MATLKRSIVGVFNGKIGEAVLTTWKDQLVARSLPTKSKKPATAAQLAQRLRFGLITGFFGDISDIIAIGYPANNGGLTPVNAAVQYNLPIAITGTYPGYAIDFTKLEISSAKGTTEIDGGFAPTITAIAGAKVTVSWITGDPVANKATKDTDLAYLVFYSTTKQRFVTFEATAERSVLTKTAALPKSFVGDKFQGYLFFASADGKAVSYSDYLGQFTLIA